MRLKYFWLLVLAFSIVPRDIWTLKTTPGSSLISFLNVSANETGFPGRWSPNSYLAEIRALVNGFANDATGQSIF